LPSSPFEAAFPASGGSKPNGHPQMCPPPTTLGSGGGGGPPASKSSSTPRLSNRSLGEDITPRSAGAGRPPLGSRPHPQPTNRASMAHQGPLCAGSLPISAMRAGTRAGTPPLGAGPMRTATPQRVPLASRIDQGDACRGSAYASPQMAWRHCSAAASVPASVSVRAG
jgi:hypothetical protein